MRQKKVFLFFVCMCGLALQPFASNAYARGADTTEQQRNAVTIQGVVTDETAQPLIGATVMVKGTDNASVTDIDGAYTLRCHVGDVVVVSFIGTVSQEFEVTAGKTAYDVQLTDDSYYLEDAVVTGYYTLSRERSTGAFAKVQSKDLEHKRISNINSVLEDRVAGYVDGKIRGVSTMRAVASPLVVIDGFPVENTSMNRIGETTENMPDINPEDIDNVTILKDAAAASIYGARAANGVIVITTKKAQEGRTEVSFSSTVSFKPYSFYTANRTNAADIIGIEKEWAAGALTNPDRAALYADELRTLGAMPSEGISTLLDMYNGVMGQSEGEAVLSRLAAAGYHYYDQVTQYGKRNIINQQYNARVSKTTQKNSTNISATYWKNQYEDINHDDSKLGLNFTNSLILADWLKFDTGVYVKYGRENTQSYNLLSPEFNALPYSSLVNADGTDTVAPSQIPQARRELIRQYGLNSEDLIPMQELNYNLGHSKSLETRVFGKLKADFTSWLNYDVMFQYETSNTEYNMLRDKNSNYMQSMLNNFATSGYYGVTWNLPNGDALYKSDSRQRSWNFRHQLNFNKTFTQKHNVAWILGQEMRSQLINFTDNTIYGYDKELLTWPQYNPSNLSYFSGLLGTAQLNQQLATERELLNRFISFYSNASYTYDHRYVLSGSLRWDRSNLWGTSSKYQKRPIWSVGASWNIDKESFFNPNIFDSLRLRTSYGIGGNIGRNTAPYLVASYYAGSFVDGITGGVTTPPNEDIRWEKTTTFNVGADFAMFGNRLYGSLEYYNKYSSDLLAAIQGSPTQGFGLAVLTTNNGEMLNRGFELTLGAQVIRTKEFSWNADLVYAFNHNEVKHVSMDPSNWNSRISLPTSYPTVGEALNGIYGYKWAGLSETGDPQVYDAEDKVSSGPVRDAKALVFSGTSVPVHSGTLINNFAFKGFEFNAIISLNAGHRLRSTNIPSINMTAGRISSTSNEINNRWIPGSTDTDVPRLLFSSDTENYNTHRTELYNYSDLHILNASHIRINNLSLSYRVPAALCQKVSLSSLRVQFNMENAGIIAFDKKAKYDLGGFNKPTYVWGLYFNF